MLRGAMLALPVHCMQLELAAQASFIGAAAAPPVHLHCGLQPNTAGQAHTHFPAFSKICSAFSGFAGHKSKNAHRASIIFLCGNALAKAWALECKITLVYTRTKWAFWPIFSQKVHFQAAAAKPGGQMGQPCFATTLPAMWGQHGAKVGLKNGAFTFACKTLPI